MVRFLFTVALILFSNCSEKTASQISNSDTKIMVGLEIYKSADIPFISHSGDGYYSNYLAVNIPYSPMPSIVQQIERLTGDKLKVRGEAHITVLTPVEFRQIDKFITIEEIDEIALASQIQSRAFSVVCVGRGQKEFSGKLESTYFLVVNSTELFSIRQKISDLVHKRSGEGRLLSVDDYYPHITIGFTKKDLHANDGIVKDLESCLFATE